MHNTQHQLQLTNDGQLWVYFLGCGSAFSKVNYQTNFLIIKGDSHLLVDCGTTCSRALRQAGLTITDIRNVLITHSHADHVGGLEEMILMNRYVTGSKPQIAITPEYQRLLWNRTLRGGAEMNEVHGSRGLRFTDYWDVIRPRRVPAFPRDGRIFRIGDLSIRTFRTRHYPQQANRWQDSMYSVGLVIDERVFVSGDTQFDPQLIPEVIPEGAEWYFHDAQLFPGGIHASLDELITLPPEIRSKMSLIHYGDNYENFLDTVDRHGFAGFTEPGVIYEFAREHTGPVTIPVVPAPASA